MRWRANGLRTDVDTVANVHAAYLEMHPLDVEDRIPDLKQAHGIGYCNITKCCTKVCPEHITITDNAIIPLKERVVDEFYDPIGKLVDQPFADRRRSLDVIQF